MSLSPIRILTQSDPALLQVLKLIQESFIFMIGRIDPPSSVRSVTFQDLTEKAQTDWILGVGDPVEACVVASPRQNALSWQNGCTSKYARPRHCEGSGAGL